MPSSIPNTILREIVDIHFFGECESLAARSQVDQLCGERLTRALDELLDGWGVPDDQLISIDRLQVEVTGLSSGDLEARLIPRIIEALRIELTNKVGTRGSFKPEVVRPIRRSLLQQLIFFLERGCLPWSTRADNSWTTAVSELLARLDETEMVQLRTALESAPARLRLARHFAHETLNHILPHFWASSEMRAFLDDVAGILRHVDDLPDRAQTTERFIHVLLECATAPSTRDEVQSRFEIFLSELVVKRLVPFSLFEQAGSPLMRNAVSSVQRSIQRGEILALPGKRQPERIPAASVSSRAPDPKRRRDETTVRREATFNQELIYLANGGLVIVAPYLPALFQKLDLLEEDRVRDLPTALLLLHYLVFGSGECAEWDFVLGKILCGVPIETAIETGPPLSDQQMAEANRLLEAVIANWTALKNSSPDALRATFLQREGALSREHNGWRLRLTRSAFDVLVDRLPWTISMIQLPWMPWVLRMDWAD